MLQPTLMIFKICNSYSTVAGLICASAGRRTMSHLVSSRSMAKWNRSAAACWRGVLLSSGAVMRLLGVLA